MGNYINTEKFWFDEEYVDKYPLPELQEQQKSQQQLREIEDCTDYSKIKRSLSDFDTELAAKRFKSMDNFINADKFWATGELLEQNQLVQTNLKQSIYHEKQQHPNINEQKPSNISFNSVSSEETDSDIDMLSDSNSDTDEDSDSDCDAASTTDSNSDTESNFDSDLERASDKESNSDGDLSTELDNNLDGVYNTDLAYHMYRYKNFMRHKECQLLTWAKSKLVLTQEIITSANAEHDPNIQCELKDLKQYRRRLLRLAYHLENIRNTQSQREPTKPAKLLRKCTELSRVKLNLFKKNGQRMSDIYIE